MKYKYYLLALLTGILFLTGCYDDKGNYDYKEINDIVIDTVGFKMTYTVLQYEELQIDPTVAFTRNPIPEGNLSYEWYITSRVRLPRGNRFPRIRSWIYQ